jgi:hypothetical protein
LSREIACMAVWRVSKKFAKVVERRRVKALQRIESIPISVLIWGPDPGSGSAFAHARLRLREELLRRGHLVSFSEDLVDLGSPRSILAQQVAQAEAYDIVFSIPASPGSVAELHDFARIPLLSRKLAAFLNREWDRGYSNRSLIQAKATLACQIHIYDPTQLPECIVDQALEVVGRLQELRYMAGQRP